MKFPERQIILWKLYFQWKETIMSLRCCWVDFYFEGRKNEVSFETLSPKETKCKGYYCPGHLQICDLSTWTCFPERCYKTGTVLVFRQDGELNFREHLYRQRTSDNKRPQNCWLIAPNFQKGKLSPRKVKLCAQVFTAHTLHIWCLVGHFFRCFWYVCVCARVRVRTQLLNQVWSLVTLWTIAHQVPQSVGILRWEY